MNLVPVFLIGLLGSVHCVGMCGGIVGAFSMTPVRVKTVPIVTAAPLLSRTLLYNLGRISSYVVAGSIVGGMGGGVRLLTHISAWQSVAYVLANLILVVLGLYLMQIWTGLTSLEVIGQKLWHFIKPLTQFLLPIDTPVKLVLAGSIWGWLPCGMVYSVLLTAMLSGTASSGAMVMLAFGLGTLPTLLAAGVFCAQIRCVLQHRAARWTSGAIVICFGLLGLLRATNGFTPNWLNAFCISV